MACRAHLTAIDRTDGSKQLAYNDIPLYYFLGDKAAGDVNGQTIGGVWFVVSPGSALGTYAPAPGDGTPVPSSTLLVGFTPELGPFLTDAKGMTIYLFTKDTTAGSSACYGDCATNWPPVPAGADVMLPVGVQGTLGSITRTDGTSQLTYNDIPLYYFANDKAAGDTNGQEVGDVWYIVPVGAKLGDPPHEAQKRPAPLRRPAPNRAVASDDEKTSCRQTAGNSFLRADAVGAQQGTFCP